MLSIYITIYVWNQKKKKVKLIETESTKAVARAWEVGEVGRDWQRAQTFIYQVNKVWGSNTQHGDDNNIDDWNLLKE